jgi:hypothetical protein
VQRYHALLADGLRRREIGLCSRDRVVVAHAGAAHARPPTPRRRWARDDVKPDAEVGRAGGVGEAAHAGRVPDTIAGGSPTPVRARVRLRALGR